MLEIRGGTFRCTVLKQIPSHKHHDIIKDIIQLHVFQSNDVRQTSHDHIYLSADLFIYILWILNILPYIVLTFSGHPPTIQ